MTEPTLAELGEMLRRLRRREARTRGGPELTYRELAAKTGWALGIVSEYFAGKALPPTDRFDTLIRLLGASPAEQGALATARDRLDEQRRRAPAEATTVAPRQLPMDIPGFVGRAGYLAELDALLEGGVYPVVAVSGPAGVGKTALAVHWAHRVGHQFEDGQLYANLNGYAPNPPLRPIDALAAFLRALGVAAEQVPVDLDEAAATYRSLLAQRRMLVVLDNALDSEQVRPLLPASPGCLVVVTGRGRLAGLVASEGARVLAMEVLSQEEACALLTRIVGEARLAAEPAAMRDLARLCAHLPLALRIAAANLAARPRRSVAGYVRQLAAGNRVASLVLDGDETSAVQKAIDLSIATLTGPERLMFRRLGLIPGPDVTPEAAAALADVPAERALTLLDRLAVAHMVDEPAEGRFTFHDLLREDANARAHAEDSAAERMAALKRLFDWYLAGVDAAANALYAGILRLEKPSATTAGPPPVFDDAAAALAWLDTERPNLVAAVTLAAKHGPRTEAWLLADALRGYFHLRMFTVDWLSVAGAGHSAAELDGDPQAQAAALLSLGDLHWRLSRYPQAIQAYSDGAALAARAGWSLGHAAVLGNLGNVLQQSGRLEEAAEQYREALAIAQRCGWDGGVAANLENLGAVYWELGRLAEAADHSTRAIKMLSEAGFHYGEAVGRTGLGEVLHALGRLNEADGQLTTALALHREIGNRGGEAETLRVLATIERDRGRLGEALDRANAALQLAREAGDRRYEADALNTVATVQQLRGHLHEAAETHQQALQLAREIGNRYPEAEALIGLSITYQALGRLDQALAYARHGRQVAQQVGYRLLEYHATVQLGLCASSGPATSRS